LPEFRLSIVNVCPGNITTELPVLEIRSGFLNRRRVVQGVDKLMPEYYSRYEASAFKKVGVGEKEVFEFPIETRCVLDLNPRRIGIRDSLGRNHWARRQDLEKARREYAAKSGGP
jgi:hypothetical protein